MVKLEQASHAVEHINKSIEKDTDQALITKLNSEKAELEASVDVLVEKTS